MESHTTLESHQPRSRALHAAALLPRGSPAPAFSWKKVINPLQALPGQSHPHAAQAGSRQGQHSSFWDWIQCLALQGEGFPKNILLSKEERAPSGVCFNMK